MQNGLSRTQQQILEIVAAGESRPGQLFAQNGLREEAPYMGDWSFWQRLAGLCRAPDALLACEPHSFRFPPAQPLDDKFRAQRITVTETGQEVLANRVDYLQLQPINVWIGGVHLHEDATLWRWDQAAGKLIRDNR